ncbi:MAG TPA: hypothetical protein PKY37_01445 [Paludibacteraceae bacterium]|nr:hypothetical protein [Paludibacteraceae bacterium]
MKSNLFEKWNAVRIIRVLLAVVLAIWAVVDKEYWMLAFSALFLIQAILGTSCCCGGGSCDLPNNSTKNSK